EKEIIESVKDELAGQDLHNVDFKDARLSNANLKDADLSNTVLKGANLTGADLRGADLTGAKGIILEKASKPVKL
ncbi:pentapeptide repeat-containing protein, partial [bacterium]|nr:pentapeptide repeat-containing protein [bacterium]